MLYYQLHKLSIARKIQHLFHLSESDFHLRYFCATVGISVAASDGIWLSMFSETHMANHWSLKTLDHDSVCVVKSMARVLDDCIQVVKIATFGVFHLGEFCLIFYRVVIISVWHMYHFNTNTYMYLHMYNKISTFHLLYYTAWQHRSNKYEKS